MSRSIRLLKPPGDSSISVLQIEMDGKIWTYVAQEVEAEDGRAFAVKRFGWGPTYHVRIGQEIACECKGFLAGGQCRHSQGLLALISRGKL